MSSAWFTLLGVALTATVTVAGLVVKHYWDVQAERRQAAHERDVGEVEHRRTLERLKLEQEEARGRDLRNLRRDIYARFLSGTQVIYRNIVAIRREKGQPGRRCLSNCASIHRSCRLPSGSRRGQTSRWSRKRECSGPSVVSFAQSRSRDRYSSWGGILAKLEGRVLAPALVTRSTGSG